MQYRTLAHISVAGLYGIFLVLATAGLFGMEASDMNLLPGLGIGAIVGGYLGR